MCTWIVVLILAIVSNAHTLIVNGVDSVQELCWTADLCFEQIQDSKPLLFDSTRYHFQNGETINLSVCIKDTLRIGLGVMTCIHVGSKHSCQNRKKILYWCGNPEEVMNNQLLKYWCKRVLLRLLWCRLNWQITWCSFCGCWSPAEGPAPNWWPGHRSHTAPSHSF